MVVALKESSCWQQAYVGIVSLLVHFSERGATRLDKLETIAEEIRRCTRCGLCRGRGKAVPGEGPADAKIMFIGEGPGYHEDRMGRPFVGPAGQFLSELLSLAGMRREDVFIANVVKCRPPQNRDPLPEEITICTEAYLFRQIEAIDPQVIVTLGRFSMALYLPDERISRIHGQPYRLGHRLLVPMIHPAAALHQPENRPLIEEDFRRLPDLLIRAEQDSSLGVHPSSPRDVVPLRQGERKRENPSPGMPVADQMMMF